MQLINDLSVKLKRYEKQINRAIARVIESGWLVLGPEVEKFEGSFADYQARKYCVSVANGTDALELALRAIGVQTGEVVATVANAGAYSTTAINSIGAVPHFLEVDQNSQCASFDAVKRAVDLGVKAVVVTHLFGRVTPDIVEIAELCKRKGVPLLEDCAQAHGASLAGTLAGAFGDIASFSFYPTKNLGALGDGGAVVTNSASAAKTVRQLRQYGWSGKYEIQLHGGRNSRLDAIQAALLNEFLPHLDEWNDQRLSIARRYDAEIINHSVTKPKVSHDAEDRSYVAHLYVIQAQSRDSLRAHLSQHKIMTDVHYPIPDHRQQTAAANSTNVVLPITETLADHILTLPCYPGMSSQQVNHVIKSVNSWAA